MITASHRLLLFAACAFLSMGFSACNEVEFKGDLNILQGKVLAMTSNKGRQVQVSQDTRATLIVDPGKNEAAAKLKINGVTAEFVIPNSSIDEKNFKIDYTPASATGQSFGIAGRRHEVREPSYLERDWFRCEYSGWCEQECFVDDRGRRVCRDRYSTRCPGQEYLEVETTPIIEWYFGKFYDVGGDAVAALTSDKVKYYERKLVRRLTVCR